MNEQIPTPAPTTQPTTPQPIPQIRPVTLVFVGQIQNPAVKNLRAACCGFVTNGTKEIQILFSSSGGDVVEGFSLYNFLRTLPVKLTMHAIGYVDSMAMVVFLAADQRFCTPDSSFLFHDFSWGTPSAVNLTRSQWGDLHGSLERTRIRAQELLKLRTSFKDEDFKSLELYNKSDVQDAGFAKKMGVVQDIKEAFVPAGSIMGNIDA
jgi:ATP-dependent protease ClpP protease subunit